MKEPQYYSRLGRIVSTQGGNLPHWSQRCATFVTFRLGDSLPEGKLAQLQAEREDWLKAHPWFQCRRDVLVASDKDGQNPPDAARCRVYVNAASRRVSEVEAEEYRELFSERVQRWLDAEYGSCILRQAEARRIVEDALCHFAAPMEATRRDAASTGEVDVDAASCRVRDSGFSHDVRYSLYAFVVMPNHVHVLFMPEEGHDGRTIVQGWKSYTAKAINRVLGRTGSVWQKESYDHLVRDVEEFNAIRAYIRGNNAALAYDAYPV